MNVSHTNDITEFIRQNKTLSYSHVIHDIAFRWHGRNTQNKRASILAQGIIKSNQPRRHKLAKWENKQKNT